MSDTRPRRSAATSTSDLLVVYLLILVTSAIELCLSAADLGWIGSPYWRGAAYGNGAFYSHMLSDWSRNFPGQQFTMFITYAFLHAGLLHLLVNMLALVSFGTVIARQVGAARFLLAYLLCAIGGALFYAVLGTSDAPRRGRLWRFVRASGDLDLLGLSRPPPLR